MSNADMVHVPQKLYTYNELPDEIKATVLKAHEAKACEYEDWYCEIYDTTMHEMRSKGIDLDDVPRSASCGIHFTGFGSQGFGSQGDGASFTGWINLKDFMQAHIDLIIKVPELYHMLGTAGQEPLVDIECSLTRIDNRYYHEKTVEFRWDVQWVDGDAGYEDIGQLMCYIEHDIQDICRGYMRDLYAELCQEYDYLQSEQCLINNDLRYTADGEEIW